MYKVLAYDLNALANRNQPFLSEKYNLIENQ